MRRISWHHRAAMRLFGSVKKILYDATYSRKADDVGGG